MSIASEITRLQGVKADILQAISDKGVEVPQASALGDCAGLIQSIATGGTPYVVQTKRIDARQGILVVDEQGFIGANITNYYPSPTGTYYNNFAIVIGGADYSELGLGKVTFLEEGTEEIGGTLYSTVTIGGKTWMAENLDYKFSGCDIGPSTTTNSNTAAAQAWYYNNDEATYGHGTAYNCGLLYNGYASVYLQNNRSTLIPGWHVASSSDYESLKTAVGSVISSIMAVPGSIASGYPYNTWKGTDDYGFGWVPCGYMSTQSENASVSFAGFNSNSGAIDRTWTGVRSGINISVAALNAVTGTPSMSTFDDSYGARCRGYFIRLVKDT